MYGLLVENLSEFIKKTYGEDKWEEIRHLAKVDQPAFSTHQVYSEVLVPKIAKKACQVLKVTEEDFMFEMGRYFVAFVGQYGYDRMLSVLGRHVRDFINGLDNLHEYLKFSYPRMRPPSFFCESESSTGMTLHYRSKRKGYAHYTMGQIKEVAKHFYNTEIKIELIREEIEFDTSHTIFQVEFDNKAFALQENLSLFRDEMTLPLRGNIIFEIFPFCILFGPNMTVKCIGNSLMQILPNLIDKKLVDWFDLVRPLIDFKFQNILKRTNNIFEISTSDEAKMSHDGDERRGSFMQALSEVHGDDHDEQSMSKITLKGQMIFMEEWKMILFLCTPVMPDLDSMIYAGLYINDLSMHDFSRDLMLAGTQQSVELKLALDQEQLKSKKLEESMKLLDEEMKRTDELLYQMIPKQVADRLRKGENPVDTCETFESVTILFSDVVTFTEICSRINPMEVVSLLNAMYSIFDNLTEKHNVYKVETIGDAYMVVAGAPERREKHGEMVCNMALDMVEAITDLKDPSTGNPIRIRVGVHTGMVVAGVVGMKMPRYCLFGDAVNTASRMESTSEALKVHISETTLETLSNDYTHEERGEISVKGKGVMKTYWLLDCKDRVSCKGEFKIPDIREAASANIVRRGSQVSRTYSPVTYHEIAQRSLSSATPSSHAQPHTSQSTLTVAGHEKVNLFPDKGSSTEQKFGNVLPSKGGGPPRARAKTFSNAGFEAPTSEKSRQSPRPSLTNQTIAGTVAMGLTVSEHEPPKLESKLTVRPPIHGPAPHSEPLPSKPEPISLPPEPPTISVSYSSPAEPLAPAESLTPTRISRPPPPQIDNFMRDPNDLNDSMPQFHNNNPISPEMLSSMGHYPIPQYVYPNNAYPQAIIITPEMFQKAPAALYNAMAEKLVFGEQPSTAGQRPGSQYRHRIVHSHTCVLL